MLQSFLVEPGTIRLEQKEIPVPGVDEVLIHMELAGICGSDVHLFEKGHRMDGPLTIGHEGIGRIEALGTGIPDMRMGERVVIEPNIPCSDCPECRKGMGNVCRNKRINGVTETGCFAEYLCFPAEILRMKQPDSWKLPSGKGRWLQYSNVPAQRNRSPWPSKSLHGVQR